MKPGSLYGSHVIPVLECSARESRPAVRPRANHAGRRILWRFAPRLTALGLDGGRARIPCEPAANWEGTQVKNLCYGRSSEGLPVPGSRRCFRRAARMAKAEEASSEWMPGYWKQGSARRP